MKNRIFILCAGDGFRWDGFLGCSKQLASFGGEPLVTRLARQLTKLTDAELYLVTRSGTDISAPGCCALQVDHTNSLAETIFKTSSNWVDRNVFLLGDVFYSDAALTRIMRSRRPIVIGGRPWPSSYADCGHGEMFAFGFHSSVRDPVCVLLAKGMRSLDSGGKGNVWNLYQILAGEQLGTSFYNRHHLLLVDDYTNDIDTPEDYRRRKALYDRISFEEQEPGSYSPPLALWLKHHLIVLRWWVVHSLARLTRFRGFGSVWPAAG